MAKPTQNIPQEHLDLYDNLVKSYPGVDRKGKNNPYTSVNGHMFSFLDKTGVMGLRFSDEDLQLFNDNFKTGPNIQYGKIMRGYAVIPFALLQDTEALRVYFHKSYEYVSTLKPKPSAKKKK